MKELWFRDKAYKMKKPSIDRINNDENYEYSNCRFIENRDNCSKNKRKLVHQYTKEQCYINTFISVTDASKQTNVNCGNISECCNNKRKSAGGFIWRYK